MGREALIVNLNPLQRATSAKPQPCGINNFPNRFMAGVASRWNVNKC